MKPVFHLLIFLLGLFCVSTFIGCNSKYDLEASKNFDSEVEQQQNLEFSFNKDLVPDSLLNRWDSTAYLEIKPAVKGAFKWNSTNVLVFSPAEAFAPGTEYTAMLTQKLFKHSRKKYSMDNGPLHFHTAPLRVNSAHLSWTKAKNQENVVVQLDLGFNYSVSLNEAVSRLKLSCGGNPVTVNSWNSGNGKSLSLQFTPVNDKDEITPLQINIAKGIPVVGSKYISQMDTSFSTGIPSRYTLAVTGVTAQHTGNEGIITVSTSQPIVANSLKKLITLDPSVQFDVTVNDAGFTVTSNEINVTQMYQLNIAANLEGVFGGKLKNNYSEQVSFGKLRPSISFINSKGMYISSAGYKNLSLNIINVPLVEVSVIKVYENNLEHFMRRGESYDYHYDEAEREGSSFQYFDTQDVGDTIFHKTYETGKLPRQNAAHILHLDFEDRIKSYNGVYVIQVASKEHNWIQQSKVLAVSDIGLIVKEEKDNIYVFANSIKKATPLSDVSVSFVSTTNQKLYTAITDAEGVAVFKDIDKQSPGFKVGLVSAKKGDEFNFVWLAKTKIGTSRFDVGGRKPNETGLIAMIYSDRNLYRPGETINVSAIVRDEQWKNEADVPVKMKLVMPNGKEFATARKILNEQGSCETSFNPPVTAMTGTYVVELYSGNDVLLNSYNISVEEFMPDRMRVTLKTDKEQYQPGDNITAEVLADNLYGTPAADRKYQCEFNLSKGTFTSEKYTDYSFAIANEFKFNEETRQGKTNNKGGATEVFKLEREMANAGLLNGNISSTVFDENGRPVHRYAHFAIHTQPLYLGIKCSEQYVSSRLPVTMSLIALDKDGNPQAAEARVVVIKKEWHTVIQKSGSSYRYVSQSEERIITQQKLNVSASGTNYAITPHESGEYEIRVFAPGSESYVSKVLYAYGWNDTQYTSFEVNNEGNIEIKTDKKQYNAGDNVSVLFTTPFEGRMLVTLEREHLVKHYYLNTKNKSASLSFKADEELLPNVYVTATLIRPMDGSDLPLTVAHGFKSVAIAEKNYELPVKITSVEKSRSHARQTISLKTSPGAYVTIAAVDEGILQVKNFNTPDPYGYFYQKVALSVNSYDIYPWLMPESKSTLSSTGGDGAENANLRLNPMFVNRVKNVAFWSGVRQADNSGNVKYDIDIPQFSGDIRVMAVAYKNKGMGSSEKHIKVADPVVISTGLPRFLSPGDEVMMPVNLSNTTGKSANATISVKTTGQLNIKGSEQTVQIPAHGEKRLLFDVTAQPSTGAATVTVSVKAFDETFVDKTDIGVRPPVSLQKITGSGMATQNSTTRIPVSSNFIAGSASGKLVVSKSPLVQFTKNLDELVNYPYGCVEQTVSSAFPQLYYADLVKSMNAVTDKALNPMYNVQQAINKVQAMQLGNGGLSYWPTGGEESWWGSVYACHFLLEAKKAGYEVSEHTVDRLEEYMKFKLYKKELMTFFYNGKLKKEVAPEEIPYSMYVLAMAGQPQQATMNYYKAHKELLTLDGKYLLAAAYALSGQPSQAKEVMPPAFSGEVPDHCFGGSFYSYIRDEALSLNVLLDIDPHNTQVGTIARQLSTGLAKERYLNTQENAFSMLAMGKIARMAYQTTASAIVTAGGKMIGSTQGEPIAVNLKSLLGQELSVRVNGKGGYYYFWEVDGIPANGSYNEEDSYIRVRRTFFDRYGNEIGNTFRQNDLVVVRVSVEAEYDATIDNVAITDMLPAGFEIENARLNEMPKFEWIKEQREPDYKDIRDDRINMFTSVTRKRKDFYYMARAVSPGTYKLGPVQADAMYDGNYHSYSGGGTVKILE